jgi:hypothetical protein
MNFPSRAGMACLLFSFEISASKCSIIYVTFCPTCSWPSQSNSHTTVGIYAYMQVHQYRGHRYTRSGMAATFSN